MDTSAEYVRMCNQSFKFRKTWKPAVGDFYFSTYKTDQCVKVILDAKEKRVNKTWLPRVDQLFDLIEARYNVAGKPAYALNKFHQYIMAYAPWQCDSVEQLLFQFVMHELYDVHYSMGLWQPNPPKITL